MPQEVIDNSIDSWDVSAAQDGSIVTYLVDTNTKGNYYDPSGWIYTDMPGILDYNMYKMYDLYIVSSNTIFLSENSSFLFHHYINLTSINNLNLISTSNVTDMNNMFVYCTSLMSLDLSNFDTSNVTNMSGMFGASSSLNIIYTGPKWTTANADISDMYSDCGTDHVTLKA